MSAFPARVTEGSAQHNDDARTWISKTPGVCGGDACVRDTRVPVWVLEGYRRKGLTVAQLLHAYPGLSTEDLGHAFEYAADHADEIEEALRDNEAE